MGRLASLMFALPHLLEWDCIDDIVKEAIFALGSHVFEGGIRDRRNERRWANLICAVFRWHIHSEYTKILLINITQERAAPTEINTLPHLPDEYHGST